MPPIIDKKLCKPCGICVDVCPMDIYFSSKRKSVPNVSYPEECWHCNACVVDCPTKAIRLRLPACMVPVYK